MATTERLGLLVLVGGPTERGRQHGETLRERVQAAVGRFEAAGPAVATRADCRALLSERTGR